MSSVGRPDFHQRPATVPPSTGQTSVRQVLRCHHCVREIVPSDRERFDLDTASVHVDRLPLRTTAAWTALRSWHAKPPAANEADYWNLCCRSRHPRCRTNQIGWMPSRPERGRPAPSAPLRWSGREGVANSRRRRGRAGPGHPTRFCRHYDI